MQLKSGEPVWLRSGAAQLGEGPLAASTACEVAVIGAGITGAMAAERLTSAGVDVVMLDGRPACQGSTSASTGLIQYELDTTLLELVKKRGEADAFNAYRVCAQALERFGQYLEERGLMAGVHARESLYLAMHMTEMREFREECRARKACGIRTRFISAGELRERFALERPGGIWSPGALAVDPYLLSTGLLFRAIRNGLRLHTPVRVVGYDANETGVTLRTAMGLEVRASRVVFATGYETPTFLNVPVSLKTTFAISSVAGTGGPGWDPGCMVWESARPYLYARGGPGGRVIVGGADEPWRPDPVSAELVELKAGKLVAKFGGLYPQVAMTVEQAWSGVFAETADGLPFIGGTRHYPRGYFALGYGGNGILFSYIASEIISHLFLGKTDDRAGLFAFDRLG